MTRIATNFRRRIMSLMMALGLAGANLLGGAAVATAANSAPASSGGATAPVAAAADPVSSAATGLQSVSPKVYSADIISDFFNALLAFVNQLRTIIQNIIAQLPGIPGPGYGNNGQVIVRQGIVSAKDAAGFTVGTGADAIHFTVNSSTEFRPNKYDFSKLKVGDRVMVRAVQSGTSAGLVATRVNRTGNPNNNNDD